MTERMTVTFYGDSTDVEHITQLLLKDITISEKNAMKAAIERVKVEKNKKLVRALDQAIYMRERIYK